MIDLNDDRHRKILEELFDIATPEQSNKLKHVFGDATPPPKRGVKGTRGRPNIDNRGRGQLVSILVQVFLCSRWPNDASSTNWAIHQVALLGIGYRITEGANSKFVRMDNVKSIHARFYDSKNIPTSPKDWIFPHLRALLSLCVHFMVYPKFADYLFPQAPRKWKEQWEYFKGIENHFKSEGLEPWKKPGEFDHGNGTTFIIPIMTKEKFETLRRGLKNLTRSMFVKGPEEIPEYRPAGRRDLPHFRPHVQTGGKKIVELKLVHKL